MLAIDSGFPGGPPTTRYRLVRYAPTGEIDASFATAEWDVTRSRAILPSPPVVVALRVLDDGSLVLVRSGDTWANGRVTRLTAAGTPFPGHALPEVPPITAATILPDGAVYVHDFATRDLRRITAFGVVEPGTFGGRENISSLTSGFDDAVFVAGPFLVYAGVEVPFLAKVRAVPRVAGNPPRILDVHVDSSGVGSSGAVSVHATVIGSAPLAFDWRGVSEVTTNVPNLRLDLADVGEAVIPVAYLTARNADGAVESGPIPLQQENPRVVVSSSEITVSAGGDLLIHAAYNPAAYPVEALWLRDGMPVPRGESVEGNSRLTLTVRSVGPADAGVYTLVLRNAKGIVTSEAIRVRVDERARLVNLSTRVGLAPEEPPLTVGFSIEGEGTKELLLRAVGPSLSAFGIDDGVGHPHFTVHNAHGDTLQTVGDWAGVGGRPELVNRVGAEVRAFPLLAGAPDAAESVRLQPGLYTLTIAGNPGEVGTVLAEVYGANHGAAEIVNLSTRVSIRPGNPAIAGFVLEGAKPRSVLVRVSGGTTLARFGVPNPLPNPRLALRDKEGRLVVENDNWSPGGPQPGREWLQNQTAAVGAFPLEDNRDAARIVELPPGNYTITAEGGVGESGTALIEIYRLP